MTQKMKKKKKARLIFSAIAVGTILTVTAILLLILFGNSRKNKMNDSPVYSSLTVEAGEPFDPQLFAKKNGTSFTVSEESKYDCSVPGDYRLKLLLSDGSERTVTLRVRDSIAPTYQTMPPLIVRKGSPLLPEELLPAEFITDATPVKVTFLSSAVSTSKEGLNTVSLKLTDAAGNVTMASAAFFSMEKVNNSYFYEIGGEAPEIGELLPDSGAEFVGENDLTPAHPGFVTARVSLPASEEECILRYAAKDTVPPTAELKSPIAPFFVGDTLPDPMELIGEFSDETEVSASYEEEYVFDRAERKNVAILLCDEGGNTTRLTFAVQILEDPEGEDVTPPVFSGVRDLTTELGVEPDYLDGIAVYDGRDGVIDLGHVIVNVSAVDLYTANSTGYEVIYTVFDAAGNKATASARLRVNQTVIPEDEMNIFFTQVVNELELTPNQSRFSTLSRVYELMTGKYRIAKGNANSDLSDYRKEAYWGFRLKKGSSETACAMLQVVLDKLNIEYVKVSRQALGIESHSWLMVDYGIGWLHVDTTPTYGYIWTKDGNFYKEESPEAQRLSSADEKAREAMTLKDLDELTALSNGALIGWNYYKTDLSELPETAQKNASGQYVSPKYTVSYEVNRQGYGSIVGTSVQTVSHGGKTTVVTAVPKNGYKFMKWSDGVTAASRSDVAKRNMTLTAEFAPDSQTITYYTVNYEAEAGGKIVGNAVQEKILYNNYTEKVTATAEDGYYFVCWEDGVKTATRSDLVVGNASYKAVFARRTVLSYVAGEGGHIEGISRQKLIPGSTGSPVEAVPDPGYLFKCWSDGMTSATRSDLETDDHEYVAEFIKDSSSYIVKYVADDGGHIEGEATQAAVSGAMGTTVRAVADKGYAFVSWSDGKTTPERRDVIYGDTVCTASFRKLSGVRVIYDSTKGGHIEGEAIQTVFEGESTTEVRAVADEGYVFVCWMDDGKTDAVRSDTPNGSAVYLVAVFEKCSPADEPTVTPDVTVTSENDDPSTE